MASVLEAVEVEVAVRTAYNQWTQFEDFPQFMGGVKQVEQLDDDRLHWVAQIGGVKREWDATILDQRPDEKVAWAASEGATHAGAVYFSTAGAGQTSVTLELEYEPEGLVEKAADAMNFVAKQVESDLERFKAFIESRNVETGAWRGDVEGATVGAPGVESATSQGDSGKTGISGKAAAAAAAGVAAAGAGIAAAAAARSGSDEQEAEPQLAGSEVPATAEADIVHPDVVEESTYTAPATDATDVADDTYGTEAGHGEEVMPGGVELDSTTPGTTEENDGRPQTGTI